MGLLQYCSLKLIYNVIGPLGDILQVNEYTVDKSIKLSWNIFKTVPKNTFRMIIFKEMFQEG